VRIALEQAECLVDGVYQWPVEAKQFAPGAPGKYDMGHRSTSGAKLFELLAKLRERDDLIS